MDKGSKWLDDNSKHYPSKEYLKDLSHKTLLKYWLIVGRIKTPKSIKIWRIGKMNYKNLPTTQ